MVRTMMRSMVRSMVRSVSQGSRSGWSVSPVSRLRVDRGSLVPHVGNESALELGFILDNFENLQEWRRIRPDPHIHIPDPEIKVGILNRMLF